MATMEDLQIVGHVLHFVSEQHSGAIELMIVYNGQEPNSVQEADAIAGLLKNGLTVDDLVLHPVEVDEAKLPQSTGYGAIMTAEGVQPKLVRASMAQQHVPCVTLHPQQVQDGACLVAIRSLPSVSITLNGTAASEAGVRFATAFRMMVREL